MGIFDASNESYLREEDAEDPELDEGEFRSFYVIVKNNNPDDRRDVPVWFRVDGGTEQPMNELEHYSRSPYIVYYPNFGETKGLILSPKATPHNSARADPEKIWVLIKALFRRCT